MSISKLFDEYANLSPEGAYWIEKDNGPDDYDYCRKHALAEIEKNGGLLCGGHYRDVDTCLHCEFCGKLLGYTLTDHGRASELDHFRTTKFRRDKPLDRETAYHLARMLHGNEHNMGAIHVAARAIRCMKKLPTPPER